MYYSAIPQPLFLAFLKRLDSSIFMICHDCYATIVSKLLEQRIMCYNAIQLLFLAFPKRLDPSMFMVCHDYYTTTLRL